MGVCETSTEMRKWVSGSFWMVRGGRLTLSAGVGGRGRQTRDAGTCCCCCLPSCFVSHHTNSLGGAGTG